MLHILSLDDIVNSEIYTKLSEKIKNKENLIKACLWELGLNTNQNYEMILCTHRATITNRVVTTYRYSGYIREDDEWNNKVLAVKKRYFKGWL